MAEIESFKHGQSNLVNDISKLKKRLDEVNRQKEFWFEKKEALKKDIYPLINQMRSLKIKKDQSNIAIIYLKKERDKYNKHMQIIIEKLNNLNKQKVEVFRKYKLKEDPYKVQAKIEAIERKLDIETSFENEKKLMKQLNELKKIFKESKIRELIEKIDNGQRELEETKKRANDFHKKLTDNLKGKNGYSEFIALSRKINEVRFKQEEAFNNFILNKKEFLKINELLKNKLKESTRLRIKVEKSVYAPHRRDFTVLLKEKTKDVLEKFKKKKKLTTEDLLILQGEK